MIYDIKKYTWSVPTEISFADYVTDIDKIPYLTRNRDYSLVCEGYSFRLSYNSSVTLDVGDRILFYRDTVLIHVGLIEKIILDEEELLYKIDVKHILQDLKTRNTKDSVRTDEFLNPQTFVERLLNDSVTRTVGTTDFQLIGFKKLVEAIFDELNIISLTVDWTNANLYTEPSFQWMGSEVGTDSIGLIAAADTDDIYFLPEQINCMNQDGIFAPDNIIGDGMDAKRPSLWDLLSILCSMVGLNFVPKTATSFYAVCGASTCASISDDNDLYDIEEEEIEPDASGVNVKYQTLVLSAWLGTINYNPWVSGNDYYLASLVSYGGAIYMCVAFHTNGTTAPPSSSDWAYLGVIPPFSFNYYVDPQYGGNDESIWVSYESLYGVNPAQLDWFNNFNPIIWFSSSSVYVVVPQVDVNTTCMKYQKQAELNSFIHQTITTKASYIFDNYYIDNEGVYIADINTDTVEVELVL